MRIVHEFGTAHVDNVMNVSGALCRNRNKIVWHHEPSTPTQII